MGVLIRMLEGERLREAESMVKTYPNNQHGEEEEKSHTCIQPRARVRRLPPCDLPRHFPHARGPPLRRFDVDDIRVELIQLGVGV